MLTSLKLQDKNIKTIFVSRLSITNPLKEEESGSKSVSRIEGKMFGLAVYSFTFSLFNVEIKRNTKKGISIKMFEPETVVHCDCLAEESP